MYVLTSTRDVPRPRLAEPERLGLGTPLTSTNLVKHHSSSVNEKTFFDQKNIFQLFLIYLNKTIIDLTIEHLLLAHISTISIHVNFYTI